MNPKRKKLFIGILLFWILILGGFIGMKEWTLRTGTEVLLAIRPVDPRDIFRGDYVILSYDISTVEAPTTLSAANDNARGPIYVRLNVDEEGVAHSTGVSTTTPPSEALFIKGSIVRRTGEQVRVEYGIESFFVPEGRGLEIERHLRDMHAKVVIDSAGNAVLKGLVYEGEEVML